MWCGSILKGCGYAKWLGILVDLGWLMLFFNHGICGMWGLGCGVKRLLLSRLFYVSLVSYCWEMYGGSSVGRASVWGLRGCLLGVWGFLDGKVSFSCVMW